MPKIDLDAIVETNATGYPPPYDEDVAGRWYKRLKPVAQWTNLGASHVRLDPGAFSSQRHWHAVQDELVVMLDGEAVLIDNSGETIVRPGDVLAFPAGDKNGHRLHNRANHPCVFLAVSAGDSAKDHGEYPDIDLKFDSAGYSHRDGTRYDAERPE